MANSRDVKIAPRKRTKSKKQSMASTVVAVPSAMGVIERNIRIPQMRSSSKGMEVCNTEILASVFSNGITAGAFNAFVTQCVPFTFPWLNGLAANFSKYRWKYLEIIYIPNCSTTQNGQYTQAYVYDASDLGVLASLTNVTVAAIYDAVTAPVWGGADGSSIINNQVYAPSKNSAQIVSSVLDVSRLEKPWYKYCTLAVYAALTAKNEFLPAELVCGASTSALAVNCGSLTAKYCIELIEPIPLSLNS